MTLDSDNLANLMYKLLNEINVNKEIKSLGNLKIDLLNKKNLIDEFSCALEKNYKLRGKFSKRLIEYLKETSGKFFRLYEDFDDKFMIFIVGNGNVGKSTLLNSLIGYEVAKTDDLPVTWKIDVYSPRLEKEKAIIKYVNGDKQQLHLSEVKKIVDNEEKKSKDAKNKCKEKVNQELRKIKDSDERKEKKQYLEEKFLYKSNISEVWWPVEKNSLLEKCLLVDTPGLNQNLYSENQLGNVHDYYHKADGVLWLLDGQAINAEHSKQKIEELNNVFKNVGGVRENIIGVINRMDLVRNNGENKAEEVINSAQKIFGNKFQEIVHISAKQAIEGEKNKDLETIKNSGIYKLKEVIENLFLSKAQNIKNKSKIKGHDKYLNILDGELKKYLNKINEYEKIYIKKNEKLESLKQEFKNNLMKEINLFFESYLIEVTERVEIHIDALANGEKEDFIKNTMYKLDDFINNKNSFVDNRYKEMKNSYNSWEKLCNISEYKYIKDENLTINKDISVNLDLDLNSLNGIQYFNPSKKEDTFSLLGNMIGKGMFLFRKSKIKSIINNSIRQECNQMKQDMSIKLNDRVDEIGFECKNLLNTTFSNLLFDFKDVNLVKEEIREFDLKIKKEVDPIKLKEIIF